MDVVIFGCGAIGSVLATYLKISPNGKKNQVHLIGRKPIMTKITENGLKYIPYDSNKSIDTSDYKTYTSIEDVDSADVVILTMKVYSLEDSLRQAEKLIKNSNPVVIIAMNGIGLREIVEKYVPNEKIIEVSVAYPSRLVENIVTNTGGNSFFSTDNSDFTYKTFIGLFGVDLENPITINNINLKIPFRFDSDFGVNQWKKAIANIAMNGISAISMLTVGEVLERKSMHAIIKQLVHEGVAIGNKMGIDFGVDMVEWFLDFAGKDPNHKTSTFQDIIRGKKTEIEFLNGYIVRKGKLFGIKTPANEAVNNLINIIEENMG